MKKNEILTGEFIPDTKSIVSECAIFEGYKSLCSIVAEWLKENSQFENITDIKIYYKGNSIPEQIREVLDSKKEEILNGEYFPTKDNLKRIKEEFGIYSHTNDVVNKWLEENSRFMTLSELIEYFEPSQCELRPETIRDMIRKYLDLREDEILNGEYFPTTKNLRSVDSDMGNYEYVSKVVSEWINEKSRSRFKNIYDLIEYYKPTPKVLGHLGRHGYTANFESKSYRVRNAIHQTVRLIDNDKLLQLNKKNIPKLWKSFFNFLKNYKEWKFVDILSGEIITKIDRIKGKIAFHHIDGDKKNDNENNLVFLLHHNHGLITLAQIHFPELANFFKAILIENIKSVKNGEIPLSWKIGWRRIAINRGIKLPSKKYKITKLNKTLIKLSSYTKDLSKWF